MTAQNSRDEQIEPCPAASEHTGTDPLGPISLPKRSRVGGRAFALVGAASVLAVGALQVLDACETLHTSVSAPH